MRERSHFSARQNIAIAMLSCGIGLYVILAGFGLLPLPGGKQSLSGPLWVVLLSGGAFLLGGLIVLSRGAAGDGQFAGPLPAEAPFWLRALQYVSVLAIFAAFGAIGTWIAFGPGTQPFHLSVPWFVTESFGEQFARLAFGAGALLTWACTIAIALNGARKLFGRETN